MIVLADSFMKRLLLHYSFALTFFIGALTPHRARSRFVVLTSIQTKPATAGNDFAMCSHRPTPRPGTGAWKATRQHRMGTVQQTGAIVTITSTAIMRIGEVAVGSTRTVGVGGQAGKSNGVVYGCYQ
jgi:hypothetical protein